MEPKILEQIEEMIQGQKKELLSCANRILPGVTEEDLLQPNDFLELENNPFFRYEEGVLHGLQMTEALARRLSAEMNEPSVL